MNLDFFKKNTKLIYLAGGAVIAVVIISSFYVLPTRTAVLDLIEQMNDERATLQALKLPAQSTGVDEEEIKNTVDRVNGVLVDRSQALEFISGFEETAAKAGVKASIDLQEFDPELKQVQQIPIQVTIDATYTNLVRFLQDLNKRPEYYIFTSLNLVPTAPVATETEAEAERESGPRIRAVLTGQTYWQ